MSDTDATVRSFGFTEIREAIEHARQGGVALHDAGWHRVPGQPEEVRVAHLFDQDMERLERIARDCGVNRVEIQKEGTLRQHIDLWGKPLSDAFHTLKKNFRVQGEHPISLEASDE